MTYINRIAVSHLEVNGEAVAFDGQTVNLAIAEKLDLEFVASKSELPLNDSVIVSLLHAKNASLQSCAGKLSRQGRIHVKGAATLSDLQSLEVAQAYVLSVASVRRGIVFAVPIVFN